MSHTLNPSIVRAYDIRGTIDKTLTTIDATMIGRAFGTVVARAGGKHVMVGYDGRTHSPSLEAALVKGLMLTGLKVTRIGLGPTPMLYFAVCHSNASAGIMVTGSHNPPDQNGFKMVIAKHLPGGGPLYGPALKKLEALIAMSDFVGGNGTESRVDVREMYIQRLLRDIQMPRALKVVWDIGNGAAGEIAMRIKAKIPGQHTMLFTDIDGRFPNHPPDPTLPENLQALVQAVKQLHADVGIAFDGDADCIVAVDHQGRILAGDQLLAFFAEHVLKTNKGATIVGDVKCSNMLFDRIGAQGGKPIMWKSGHAEIKAKMTETKAHLGGEMSGHICFADKYYGYDDGFYAGLRLLNILSSSSKSLADWRNGLPVRFVTPEIRFKVDEARKFRLVEEVRKRVKAAKMTCVEIDGVRVSNADGWWLLRASNTENALTGRAESETADGLSRLKAQLLEQLELSGLSLPHI